jgi:GntR family transcriptional regulator / MocR family aminotransferase
VNLNEQPKSIDASDLPLTIAFDEATPGYWQLANQLRALIDSRALRVGTKLPSSRALARTLRINRNTVVAAFERLTSLGLIETRGRGGSVVSEFSRLTKRSTSKARSRLRRVAEKRPAHRPRIDFRLGSADPSPLPIKVWRRACREAGRHLPGPDYGDPRGDTELRSQIALYLGRTRAMRVNRDELMITAGSGQAIERIAEVTLRLRDSAAVEEPGYLRAAKVFQRFGARLVPIPVDDDGVNTDRLLSEKRNIRLIHVTPSHQYPLGARLSSARRHTLIRWARENDALIIENDYDGEFRYGAMPLPALGSLAGFDHIAYVGTFSKVLSPSIRLGFVVARPDLIEAMAEVVAQTRESVSIVTQRIVAWLIKSGELERHVRRTRKSYSTRRAVMLRALGELPQIQSVSGHAAGLHMVVELRKEIPAKRISARLEGQGVVMDRVADFQLGQQTDDRLLMAYGHLTEAEILAGIGRLGAAIRR